MVDTARGQGLIAPPGTAILARSKQAKSHRVAVAHEQDLAAVRRPVGREVLAGLALDTCAATAIRRVRRASLAP
jgi:hypothetical protein